MANFRQSALCGLFPAQTPSQKKTKFGPSQDWPGRAFIIKGMRLEWHMFKDAVSQIRQLRINEEQLLTDDLHCQWANSKKEEPTKDMAQGCPTLLREKGFTTSICGQQSQVFLGKDGSVMCDVCVLRRVQDVQVS